jgi:hypothetical protein
MEAMLLSLAQAVRLVIAKPTGAEGQWCNSRKIGYTVLRETEIRVVILTELEAVLREIGLESRPCETQDSDHGLHEYFIVFLPIATA